MEGIAALVDPAVADAVHAFAASHDLPMAGPRLDQLLERMDINVALAAAPCRTRIPAGPLSVARSVTTVDVFAVEDRSVQLSWSCLPSPGMTIEVGGPAG